MPITTLPALDRTSVTFRADVDTFFGSQLPGFAAEANALQTDVNAKQATTTTKAAEAAASATAAATSSTKAGQWADANENVAVETGKYSAKHHAIKAAASAASASGSATTATTKASEASASAATASTKASQASASATSAANSAAEAAAAAASISIGPVTSVNTKTGVVTLSAADVGAQPASANLTSFASKTVPSGAVVGTTDTQTLTNKTLSAPELTGASFLNGPIRSKVGSPTVGAGYAFFYGNVANYFVHTISANTTMYFSSIPADCFSMTIELTHTGGTIRWPASVQWPGGTAPTLTTGKTHIFIFVTDDGGARWRGAALTNYTN